MLKTNYHSHCYLCKHATGTPYEYIKKAYELGLDEFGMSDHAPLFPRWLTRRMTYQEFLNVYLPDIEKGKQEFLGKMKVYKALEIEYYPEYRFYYEALLEKLDYLILGQHEIFFDGKYQDLYHEMSIASVEEYTNEVLAALDTGYFRILAHPDLFMYKYPKWEKEFDLFSRMIIESCIKNDVLLELNANGARRGTTLSSTNEITWKYPFIDFWKIVSQYPDAKVIINSDCHSLDKLYDDAILNVADFAKKLNLNVVEKIYE